MNRSRVSAAIAAILAVCVLEVFGQKHPGTSRPSAVRLSQSSAPEYMVSKRALKLTKVTDAERAEFKQRTRDGVKLVKLFVAPDCVRRFEVDASDARCAERYDLVQISYYSFVGKVYGLGFGEIGLTEDGIVAGGVGGVFGLLLDLGDVDIGAVKKNSSYVRKMVDFPIARTVADVDKQRMKFEKGVEFEGEAFSSKFKLAVGRTFLLRTVKYAEFGRAGYDSIVAFRIDRLATDGMALVLWRRISLKNAPTLRER